MDESTSSLANDFGESQGSIEREFQFIKKHVSDIDSSLLYVLLDSEVNNPKRLETIMSDVLNIPNASELAKNFMVQKTESEREHYTLVDINKNTNPENVEGTFKSVEVSDEYLNQIQEMFPDADKMFLVTECQHMKNWEDCSRFINTVMISGVYPKQKSLDFTPPKAIKNSMNIEDKRCELSKIISSSDDEVSPPKLLKSFVRRKKMRNREKDANECLKPDHDRFQSGISAIEKKNLEIVDLSECTEEFNNTHDESIQILNEKYNVNNVIDVDLPVLNYMGSTIADDVDYLFGKRKEVSVRRAQKRDFVESPNWRAPKASRLSLPGRKVQSFDDPSFEKSLAEIIEEKRFLRRQSLGYENFGTCNFPKPSTSKLQQRSHKIFEVVPEADISSPEISTSSKILDSGYTPEYIIEDDVDEPSRASQEWIDEQLTSLIRIFPNADPSFLREKVIKMEGSSEAVNAFVVEKLEKNDMPTRAEYEKRLEMEELQNRYTKNFSIPDFLKALPDPWKFFSEENRNCSKYKDHSLCYLRSTFRNHYVRDIIDFFKKNNSNLYVTYQELKNSKVRIKGTRRRDYESNHHRPTTIDIQFLQEVGLK